MASLTSELFVKLLDGVTKPAQGMARALRGVGNAAAGLNGQGGASALGARFAAGADAANRSLDVTRGRLLDAAAAGWALTNAISSPVKAAMDFESAMADVRKVVDFSTPAGFEDFKRGLMDLSKEVPVSVEGLAAMAAAAGQAGYAEKDILRVTRAAAMLGVAFDISAEQAGDSIPKLQNSLGMTLEEVLSLTDAMNHLSNSQASVAGDILEVTTKNGAYAKMAGFTAEQTAALASAMLSTGQEVDVVGTSIRNMSRMLTTGSSATLSQKKGFAALGLEAREVSEAMQVDAMGTFTDILERIQALPAAKRGSVLSQVFGNESRALGPLVANLDLLPESLKLIENEADYAGSSLNEFEVRSATFANKVELWNNRLTALKVTIGNALIPALTDLIERITPLVEGITKFAEAHPTLTRNVLAAAAALVSFKIAATGLSFIGLYGKASALSALAVSFSAIGKAAVSAKSAIALQKALSGGGKYTGLQMMVDGLAGIARLVPGVGLASGALTAIGTAVAGISLPVWGTIAVVAAAIGSAGVLIWKYWDRLTSIFSGVGQVLSDIIPDFQLSQTTIEKFEKLGKGLGDAWNGALGILQSVGEFFSTFFTQEVLTDEEKAQFAEAGREWAQGMVDAAVGAVMGLVDWFKGLPDLIIGAIGSIDIGSMIQWPTPPDWLVWLLNGGNMPEKPATQTAPSGREFPTGIEKFAKGGPVTAGRSIIVGDGGEPEIFTPHADGFITPFSKIEDPGTVEAQVLSGGGGSGARPGAVDQRQFNPTVKLYGPFYGIDDLDAAIERAVARLKAEFDSVMSGSFGDTGTA